MADDISAAEGPWNGRPLQGLAVVSRAWIGAAAEVAELKEGQGQGVDPHYQVGHLVKNIKIKFLEICFFSLPLKEFEIIDFPGRYSSRIKFGRLCLCKSRPRLAFITIRDFNGHIGLGVKCSKEVATAIHGDIILAKFSITLCSEASVVTRSPSSTLSHAR